MGEDLLVVLVRQVRSVPEYGLQDLGLRGEADFYCVVVGKVVIEFLVCVF